MKKFEHNLNMATGLLILSCSNLSFLWADTKNHQEKIKKNVEESIEQEETTPSNRLELAAEWLGFIFWIRGCNNTGKNHSYPASHVVNKNNDQLLMWAIRIKLSDIQVEGGGGQLCLQIRQTTWVGYVKSAKLSKLIQMIKLLDVTHALHITVLNVLTWQKRNTKFCIGQTAFGIIHHLLLKLKQINSGRRKW